MAAVAIGFFDGVHCGHRAILRGADIALTFENHPLSVLAPERSPRLIMSWEMRAKAIMALGVKQVTAMDFTAELAAQPPEEFLATIKWIANSESLQIRCGENWRFGKGGVGNAEWLRARGVEVKVEPYAEYRGEAVSSTRIRQALAAGELQDANAMLGAEYAVEGERFAGKGEGGKIGYPTVNIRPGHEVLLPEGVYAVRVEGVRGIANYGRAPTYGERAWERPVIEAHFTDKVPPLEGRVRVEFVRFVREERQFASTEELVRQIGEDIRAIED